MTQSPVSMNTNNSMAASIEMRVLPDSKKELMTSPIILKAIVPAMSKNGLWASNIYNSIRIDGAAISYTQNAALYNSPSSFDTSSFANFEPQTQDIEKMQAFICPGDEDPTIVFQNFKSAALFDRLEI